jgi:hypothetical protein
VVGIRKKKQASKYLACLFFFTTPANVWPVWLVLLRKSSVLGKQLSQTKESYDMSKSFTKKFESGTFGVQTFENGSARWTLEFANGNKRFSYKLFDNFDGAKNAVLNHYIPECQQRLDAGKRMWVIFEKMSPKTGEMRSVFIKD